MDLQYFSAKHLFFPYCTCQVAAKHKYTTGTWCFRCQSSIFHWFQWAVDGIFLWDRWLIQQDVEGDHLKSTSIDWYDNATLKETATFFRADCYEDWSGKQKTWHTFWLLLIKETVLKYRKESKLQYPPTWNRWMHKLALLYNVYPFPVHIGVICMKYCLQKYHLLWLHAELLFLLMPMLTLIFTKSSPCSFSKLQPVPWLRSLFT